QRETTVLWNKLTGKPLHKAIVWQDRRTADYCKKLKLKNKDKIIQKITGLILDPYFSATKIKWILNYSRKKKKILNKNILFGTIDTWLLWKLTEGKSHLTDITNASRTMIYDPKKEKWSEELLNLFNIDKNILPEVKENSYNFGTTKLFGGEIGIGGMAGDQQARGFLLGATAGRTTLNGEGLQHEDGHSHILANTVPNCISYDPTFAYEVAVIMQDGIRRMYGEDQENVFYYLTLMNENYHQPAMPEGAEEGIRKGIYKLETVAGDKAKVQLLGSGTIMIEVRKAAQILSEEYGIGSDVFSVTSFNELTRDGQDAERFNMLNPEAEQKTAYITNALTDAVTVAATDYMKNYAEQVRSFVPSSNYKVLGTDGYGRSDSRENLRRHFEVNAGYVVVATLSELAKRGEVEKSVVVEAIKKFDIDTNKVNPLYA
ncbi:MAG: hypothetical protein GY919_14575, partial [Photobacterium aquimaris]|nr:hypothetical protein [Photobacterium aquimaris]